MNRIFVHPGASTASAELRSWPLKRDERAIEPFDLALLPDLGPQMFFIRRFAGCIDDDQQIITAICDHQIIKNAAMRVREESITQPPGR
jgi:hypothetical protein